MKKLNLTIFLLLLGSFCYAQSIISILGQDIYSDIKADYPNGNKWITFIHGSVGSPLSVGATLYIDMADYMAITGEGKDGWVTIWLDAYSGVGLPFGIGCFSREYDLNEHDSAPYFLSASGAYAPGIEVLGASASMDFENFDFKIDALDLNYNLRIEGGIGVSLSVISLEVKRETLDAIFGGALYAVTTISEYSKNILENFGNFGETISWKNILKFPVRMTTPQDSENDFLITDIEFNRLAVNQWGKVMVTVKPNVSDDYQVGVWRQGGILPPVWQWENESWTGVPYQQSYIGANQTKIFTFSVKPTSEQGRFGFWLYQDKGLWDIIQKVEYPFDVHALPEGSDVTGPRVLSALLDSQTGKIKVRFSENIDTGTFNESTVYIFDHNFNSVNYSHKFLSDQEVELSINQTLCDENIELYITSYIHDMNGNRLDQNQDGFDGPFVDFNFAFSNCPDPALTSATISPAQGTTTDQFYFSVMYTDVSGNLPSAINLVINGTKMPMDIESGSVSTGAKYSMTWSNSTPGTYLYHFEATTASGTSLRYPGAGDLSFSVIQSSQGWEAEANCLNTTYSPTIVKAGTVLTLKAGVSNKGIYTYTSIPVKIEIRNESGTLIGSRELTITNLAPNFLATDEVTFTLPSTLPDGSYSIVTTIFPDRDTNPSNNSCTTYFYIGANLGNDQFRNTNGQTTLEKIYPNSPIYNVCNKNFSLLGMNFSDYYIFFTDPSGDIEEIYMGQMNIWGEYDVAMILDAMWKNTENTIGWAALRGFCAITNGARYDNVFLNVYPGTTVYTYASAPSGYLFESSDYSHELYSTTSSTINDWYDGITREGDYSRIKVEFDIPTNASSGKEYAYICNEYTNGVEDLTRITFNVLPRITATNKSTLCPGDVITLTGLAFGTIKKTVKFGEVAATTINSWNNTSIQVIVPAGISAGNIYVTNSAGNSNGISYNLGSMPAPAEINASDGNLCDRVTISWTSVTGATGYNIFAGDLLIAGNVTGNTYDDLNATTQVTSYSVTAIGGCGESARVSDTGYKMENTPAVGYVDASNGEFCDRVHISWGSVTGATSYNLYRGEELIIAKTIATSHDDFDAPIMEVTYYVTANGTCGESLKTVDVVNAAPETGTPGNIMATDGTYCNKVEITWNPVPGATFYNVYQGTELLVGNITETMYVDLNAPTVSTSYSVTAVGFCGESAKATDTGYRCNMPTLLTPSASGITLNTGDLAGISWSGFTGDFVKIELLKGDNVYQTLAESAPNSGSFGWNLPSDVPNGTDYRVRVTSKANSAETDISDNYFSIVKLILPSVTYPSATGITWIPGTIYEITWLDFTDPYVKLELLKGESVVRTITTGTPNDGTMLWRAPALEPGADYRIRITSTANPAMTAISNNYFTLAPAISPKINYPSDQGIVWVPGIIYEILWQDFTDPYVKVELLKGETVVRTVTTGTANDGAMLWRAPALEPGADYRIRITSTANPSVSDLSDFPFILKGPETVTWPSDSNIVWNPGTIYEITWDKFNDPYVRVELLKGEQVVRTITTATPNDGTMLWRVATVLEPGNDYRIRITSTATPSMNDISDHFFTVTGPEHILYPSDPGIIWVHGTIYEITWEKFSDPYVKVEILKSDVVVRTVTTATPNDGTMLWRVASALEPGSDYRLRISSTANPAKSDLSDNPFTVTGTQSVTYPSALGIVWNAGTIYEITWQGFTDPYVKVELLKGETVVRTITTATANDGAMLWRIATTLEPGNDYRVRITSTVNPGMTDVSDNPLTIVVPKSATAFGDDPYSNSLSVYPNPFSQRATITYTLAEPGRTLLEIYDLTGRRVTILEDATREAGTYVMEWNATDANGQQVVPGMYLVRIQSGGFVETSKLVKNY